MLAHCRIRFLPPELSVSALPAAVDGCSRRVCSVRQRSNSAQRHCGATNGTTTVSLAGNPSTVAVNPLTNQIYATLYFSNSMAAIDGATNSVITFSAGVGPQDMAINSVTNKIYVTNPSSAGVTVIDGLTHRAATLSAGTQPRTVAVNPVTGKAYVGNFVSNNVTVINPSAIQPVPLAATLQATSDSQTVAGSAVFATSNPDPSFTATVTSNYPPSAPPPTALYYQLDSAQGGWQRATAGSSAGANPADYSFSLSGVPLGLHTVFFYAAYGDEGTVSDFNSAGNSPEIGNLMSYSFAILPMATTTTLTSNVNPQLSGSSVTFTAYVASQVAGGSAATGWVTFSEDATVLGQAALDGSGHAVYATSALSVGSHAVTASYSGDAGYLGSSGSMSERIDFRPQTVTFSNPGTQMFGAAPITLAATASSGLPVTYQVISGPATVSSGQLTVTGAGSVTVEASQAGDTIYAAATPVLITFIVQDFSLPAILPALHVPVGQSATAAFTVTPAYGFAGTIAFTCTVPASMSHASCSATPVQITDASAMNSTFTLSTAGPAYVAAGRHGTGWYGASFGLVFAAFLWCGIPAGRRRRMLMALLLLGLLMGGAMSCGGGANTRGQIDPGTPAGDYTLTVTATSGSASHTMSVPVTVQ